MKVGMVITFNGPDGDKVKQLVNDLRDGWIHQPSGRGKLDKTAWLRLGSQIESVDIREFNPDHGSPVFYIP